MKNPWSQNAPQIIVNTCIKSIKASKNEKFSTEAINLKREREKPLVCGRDVSRFPLKH